VAEGAGDDGDELGDGVRGLNLVVQESQFEGDELGVLQPSALVGLVVGGARGETSHCVQP
jgi:hypothetical protein